MSSTVPPTVDERDNLMQYLAQQRDAFRCLAHGLTDSQARLTPTSGELSIGGLIKHIAQMERGWLATVQQKEHPPGDYDNGFRMLEHETLVDLLADLNRVAAETDDVVSQLSLDHPVPVPRGVPWFPQDVEAWSLRWVLGHLIEELARHAGHGDIVRESIDGKTMYELQAMADGRHQEYLDMIAQFTADN